ncbi:hypothetical protein L1987_09389 [Smallanthus sonchifolius]|uniref:Uncharacterized protein n=1 Tax=Smallanthus sonchifolius TaxID=185202 RepID=A0ACB9JPH3_9ASTR|nr:hypothetical protein L1987_09389 [Smallanthus sonchifolius]
MHVCHKDVDSVRYSCPLSVRAVVVTCWWIELANCSWKHEFSKKWIMRRQKPQESRLRQLKKFGSLQTHQAAAGMGGGAAMNPGNIPMQRGVAAQPRQQQQ